MYTLKNECDFYQKTTKKQYFYDDREKICDFCDRIAKKVGFSSDDCEKTRFSSTDHHKKLQYYTIIINRILYMIMCKHILQKYV